MIRFSAFLVVVAVGTLVGGVVTSKLLLVYIAIGVSGLALLALGVGAAVNWRELTGKPETAGAQASTAHADAAPVGPVQTASPAQAPRPTPAPQPTSAPQTVPSRVVNREPAQAPAVPAVTGTTTASRAPWSPPVPAGSSRAGYLPTEPPPGTRPAAPGPWERRDAPPPSQPPAQEPAAAAPPAPDDDASIQDQTLIFRAQDPAPAGREDDAAASASEPAPEPAPAAEPEAAEPEAAAEPEPEPDVTLIAAAAPARVTAPAIVTAPAADAAPAAETAPADDSTPADEAAVADDATSVDDATTLTEPAAPDPDLEVTVVPGVPRYHKSQCILIRFMGDSDLDKMTVAAAREAGCTPCRACLPDQSDSPASDSPAE